MCSKGCVEAGHFGGFRYDEPQNLEVALLKGSTLAPTPSSTATSLCPNPIFFQRNDRAGGYGRGDDVDVDGGQQYSWGTWRHV